MIDFLQKFLDTVATYPERAAFVDKDGERSTSYKKLDELSGRVAAFLKNKGFQKEDLIAINLEKSMEYTAVQLGVIKAGIAFVPLSESMGQERFSHVLKDSGANLAASHCLKYSRYIDMLVTQATLSAPYFDSLCALTLIAIPIKTAIIINLLVFISELF